MAILKNVSLANSTGPLGIYSFLQTLQTAGWVVTASGDGLSLFSTSGSVITGGASGAGGLGNANAWMAIRSPDNVNAFVFQFFSSRAWRVKWSPGGVFNTSGAPSATRVPAATGVEVILRGSGTDASPSGSNFSHNTGLGSYTYLTVATDSAPYVFWCFALSPTSTNAAAAFAFDALDYTLPGDVSPYIWLMDAAGPLRGTALQTQSGSTTGDVYNVAMYPSSSPSVPVRCGCMTFSTVGTVRLANWQVAPHPTTGADLFIPVAIGRTSQAGGTGSSTDGTAFQFVWKGICKNTFWTGVGTGTLPTRLIGDTASCNSTRDRLYLSQQNTSGATNIAPLAIPWDGTVPVLF